MLLGPLFAACQLFLISYLPLGNPYWSKSLRSLSKFQSYRSCCWWNNKSEGMYVLLKSWFWPICWSSTEYYRACARNDHQHFMFLLNCRDLYYDLFQMMIVTIRKFLSLIKNDVQNIYTDLCIRHLPCFGRNGDNWKWWWQVFVGLPLIRTKYETVDMQVLNHFILLKNQSF